MLDQSIDDHDELERKQRHLLNQIPQEDRQIFERHYQQRYQRAVRETHAAAQQRGTLDPDNEAIEAQLILTLMREAEGTLPGGNRTQGQFPGPGGHTVFLTAPTEEPPPVGGRSGRGRRIHNSSGGGSASPLGELGPARLAILALGTLAFLLFLATQVFGAGGTSTANTIIATPIDATTVVPAATISTTTGPIAELNASGVQWSDPASLEFVERLGVIPSTVLRILPQDARVGGTWSFSIEAGVASWLRGTYINYVLCVAPPNGPLAAKLAPGDALVLRSANGSRRPLVVATNRMVSQQNTEVLSQDHAGLTLIICGGEGTERRIITAVNQMNGMSIAVDGNPALAALAGVSTAPTATQVLSNTAVITNNGSIWLPLDEPVDGYGRLQVSAHIGNAHPDRTLQPADLLGFIADGSGAQMGPSTVRWQQSVLAPGQSTQATWEYLVPHNLQGQWKLVAPRTMTEVTWSLEPPANSPDSSRAVWASISTEQVQAAVLADGKHQLQVRITLHNQTTQSVAVDLNTIVLEVNGVGYPLRPQPDAHIPVTVEPNTTVELPLEATLDRWQTAEIAVGRQRFRLTLPQ